MRSILLGPLMNIEVSPPSFPEHADDVRAMLREYQSEIELDLSFQGFETELNELESAYSSQGSGIWIAHFNGEPAGCVTLRPLRDGVGEVKRLYVRRGFRGRHLGRALMSHVLHSAHEMGYQEVVLDTLSNMESAISLYQSLGFSECEPYCESPYDAKYMRLELRRS